MKVRLEPRLMVAVLERQLSELPDRSSAPPAGVDPGAYYRYLLWRRHSLRLRFRLWSVINRVHWSAAFVAVHLRGGKALFLLFWVGLFTGESEYSMEVIKDILHHYREHGLLAGLIITNVIFAALAIIGTAWLMSQLLRIAA